MQPDSDSALLQHPFRGARPVSAQCPQPVFAARWQRAAFTLLACLVTLTGAVPCFASAPWPAFEATTLTGKSVDSHRLVGQPTLLIVTPSRDAAESTREWARALRRAVEEDRYRVRDIIAVRLPFFLSLEDALQHARNAVPDRYHDQTWLLDSAVLEKELGIPRDSHKACVVVLNRHGKIVAQEFGNLNDRRLDNIVNRLQRLK